MPSEEHEKQNIQAMKWLKKQGFGVVASNIRVSKTREIIDVIGFRSGCSIVIESKVSRSDFLADKKKPFRKKGAKALGLYRFYICPVGLIKPEEVIPNGWGLLYSDGKRVVQEFKPKGNLWCGLHSNLKLRNEWSEYQHNVDEEAEKSMLYSLCRRLAKGENIQK